MIVNKYEDYAVVVSSIHEFQEFLKTIQEDIQTPLLTFSTKFSYINSERIYKTYLCILNPGDACGCSFIDIIYCGTFDLNPKLYEIKRALAPRLLKKGKDNE